MRLLEFLSWGFLRSYMQWLEFIIDNIEVILGFLMEFTETKS